MRLHRFIVDVDLTGPHIVFTDEALLHQWLNVLRLKVGDAVVLCDGKGCESPASIMQLEKRRALVRLEGLHPITTEPSTQVTLCCAVLKRENFEWVVQKATEVGVMEIVPLQTSRTVKTGLKQERLLAIAKEAAEQSGRGRIPKVHEPKPFTMALQSGNLHSRKIFFDCARKGMRTPCSHVSGFFGSHVIIFIGPEGGFTEEEARVAQEYGFSIASLGSRVLRAETAAVVASYLAVEGMISTVP